ncbi:MAG: transposase [Clostridiales bacterium]|nr:transposase [Clostridiales bacterium]
MKQNYTQVEYTAYGTGYQVCLPMNLEIIIPSDEPVRLLSAVTEELDYRRLTATYSRLGRIEYSPRLLFKIVLYGCSRGIYKTRELERACRENVNFMYLLEGHSAPDHNTIARFRKDHLHYSLLQIIGANTLPIISKGLCQILTVIHATLNTTIVANFFASIIKNTWTTKSQKHNESVLPLMLFLDCSINRVVGFWDY